jgi:hypothetical protein
MVDALRAAARGERVGGTPARLWIPAAAGAGVLGLSVAAIVALRGGHAPTRTAASASPRVDRAPGVTIQSAPPGAELRLDGRVVGTTPATVELTAGAPRALELRKPGFASVQAELAAGAAPPVFQLAELRGFEGVWMVPGVGLRAFERSGEQVAISKLDAVDGPRTFFRRLAFEPAERGVTFATSEDIVDGRAPAEPSCHVPARVEYHYDPASDTLALRRERVAIDFVAGRCVRRSATLSPPLELVRADRRSDTEREAVPPVGKPITSAFAQKTNTTPIAPKPSKKAPPTKKAQTKQ